MKHNADIVRVSAHGGHSGQFCLHARDDLEQIVAAYAAAGFRWIGLTEHMPPMTDAGRYPDEVEAGLSAAQMQRRFAAYVATARQLQQYYAGRMTIYVAMEGEFYAGAIPWIRRLRREYALDYIVGSVHHVHECCFDFGRADYARALELCGGYAELYCAYFDAQFAMLHHLQPAVVGHFDLIRLYDDAYPAHLLLPEVQQRIERNLAFIAANGLLLDFNTRALFKGAAEPYLSAPLLRRALDMGIDLVPGDDSHGVDSVAAGIDSAIAILKDNGYHCQWRTPCDSNATPATNGV